MAWYVSYAADQVIGDLAVMWLVLVGWVGLWYWMIVTTEVVVSVAAGTVGAHSAVSGIMRSVVLVCVGWPSLLPVCLLLRYCVESVACPSAGGVSATVVFWSFGLGSPVTVGRISAVIIVASSVSFRCRYWWPVGEMALCVSCVSLPSGSVLSVSGVGASAVAPALVLNRTWGCACLPLGSLVVGLGQFGFRVRYIFVSFGVS